MALTFPQYDAVARGFTAKFNYGARMAAQSLFFPTLCTIVPSKSEDESYLWMGDVPQMREWLGERVKKQLRSANYTLANKHFEQTLSFERTKIDDDRYGMFSMTLPNMGKRAAKHPDKLLFEAINLGESTACWDGQFFFDTDHSWGDSGSQSNDLTYAAATGVVPTVAEAKAALHQAIVALLGFKDDQGEPFIEPLQDPNALTTDLICCVPLFLYEVFHTALEQTLSIEGGAATTNVLLAKPRLVACTRMGAGYTNGSNAKFDLYYTGDYLKPYCFQPRQALRTETEGITSIKDKEINMYTEARYNVGYLMWQYAVRTTFT